MVHPEKLDSQLTAKRDIAASRQRVWDVIADGWTYSQWVVGNSRMRAVDPNWPAPGSIIEHSIGVWPLVINDIARSLTCTPLEELVLVAKGWPFGAARVSLRLFDIDGGCRVEMSEVPANAALRWLPKSLSLAFALPRNRECTSRLATLAERRRPDDVE